MTFPKYVDLEFSARCNLRCGFCFGPTDDRTVADLPLDFWRSVVVELSQRECEGIVVSGGEPTIYPHLAELLQLAKSCGLKTVVSTHGRHGEKVLAIASFCDWIALPVDAFSKTAIVELRGDQWSIKQATVLARAVRQANPSARLKLGSVATKQNVRELKQLAKYLSGLADNPFSTWKIYQYTPRRKFIHRAAEYLIADSDFQKLESACESLFGADEHNSAMRLVFSSNESRRSAYVFVFPDGTVAMPNVGEAFSDTVIGNAFAEGLSVFDRVAALSLLNNSKNYERTYTSVD